ncbi:MAG: McrC family protein [Pseudomonadota bacterium]
MAILSVQEHARIIVGPEFNAEACTITPLQHSQLERANEDYMRRFGEAFLNHGPRRSLVARQFVGVVSFGNDHLEVLPKIQSDTTAVRKSLCTMIAKSLDLEIHAPGHGDMDTTHDSVLDVLVRIFCREMWQMVRSGLIRRYVPRVESLSFLRGRLSVPAQLRTQLSRPDRLVCEFDEFTEDNSLNQILKAAVRVLLQVVRSTANQRSLSELLFCLQDVTDISVDVLQHTDVKLDRLAKRWAPLFSLAKLFLRVSSQDVLTGGRRGFTLLFDMNELFEAYIGAVIRRVCAKGPTRVTLQGPCRFLAKRIEGRQAFLLKPDVVGSLAGEVSFILDTKWKRLKPQHSREGVASTDVYQMYAYATRYKASDVLLVYPHHAELGHWQPRRAEYIIQAESTPSSLGNARICVATIDLRDLATVPSQLARMLAAHLDHSAASGGHRVEVDGVVTMAG